MAKPDVDLILDLVDTAVNLAEGKRQIEMSAQVKEQMDNLAKFLNSSPAADHIGLEDFIYQRHARALELQCNPSGTYYRGMCDAFRAVSTWLERKK